MNYKHKAEMQRQKKEDEEKIKLPLKKKDVAHHFEAANTEQKNSIGFEKKQT